MKPEILILLQILIPVAGIVSCMLISNISRILKVPVITSAFSLFVSVLLAVQFHFAGAHAIIRNNFLVDALSLYHLFLVNVIFCLSAVYATGYFRRQHEEGELTCGYVRRYAMLWQAFQSMLIIVLLSNNIGIMWIAIEATTIVSSFLIISENNSLSIEAMWKYLLICSVGIVIAFMGTVLTVSAAGNLPPEDSGYLFSQLIRYPELLDSKLMLFAFILLAIGFGTKAGFSPMHTWLPDAHSQAPTPVSAVFSGVMLNCALYCIMRYLPITEAALGMDGQAHSILLLFGFLSLFFAAVFIPVQHDIKRLLAYCSVEHMGIIAIGLGLGGLGTFAALLHTANHSISKVLAFFSAGYIGEHYGTRNMRRITDAVRQVPWWGGTFFISILVLVGVAPFSVFMSELFIVREAFFSGKYVLFGLFVFGTFAVFVNLLKQVLDVSFGKHETSGTIKMKVRFVDKIIIVAGIAVLLVLGLWIPSSLTDFLKQAAAIVENGVSL